MKRTRKLKLEGTEPPRWTEQDVTGARYLELCAMDKAGTIRISQAGQGASAGLWCVRYTGVPGAVVDHPPAKEFILYSHPESDCIFWSDKEEAGDGLLHEVTRSATPTREVALAACLADGCSKAAFDQAYRVRGPAWPRWSSWKGGWKKNTVDGGQATAV